MTALPRLKARVKLNFPAVVSGVDGISVSKSNGEYSIGLGFDGLIDGPEITAANRANYNFPIYDSVGGSYYSISLEDLAAGIDSEITAVDSTFTVEDDSDASKKLQFQLSGVTTGNTRTLTVPDASGTIAVSATAPITLNSTSGDIGVTSAALTKTDDTNVTLALGGTPASALLRAVSLTLGWTGLLGLARGGTNADLSATGGTGQYLKQASAGAAVTVGTIPASDIASGQALTKTDDTNVTLTLGGTATSALLKAVSLTLGWAGLLSVARGGTGLASGTSGGVLGYTASGTLASSAALGANGVVIGGGAGATPTAITAGTNGQLLLGVTSSAPAMATMSGDATIANTGAITIANNAVTNAKSAQMAAATLKMNSTASTANASDATIQGLTNLVSPSATLDFIPIYDHVSGTIKNVTPGAIASSSVAGVASLGGSTGVITLAGALSISGQVLNSVLRSYLAGLTLSTAGSSATFGVAAGTAADSTNVSMMSLGSAYTKTTSAWAVGSTNGSLDTGSIANNTWYHVYLIQRPDTGVVDVLTSTNASSPTLPTNYTLFRRVGSLRTNGSAQWVLFSQLGDEFLWNASVSDVSANDPGTAAVSRTLTVPTGVQVWAKFNAIYRNVASGAAGYPLFSELDKSDEAPGPNAVANGYLSYNAAGGVTAGGLAYTIRTNTSAQVRSRISASDTNITLYILTQGWIDRRGKDN